MVKNNGSKPLRSGALAMAAGVSPDTIRHYERIGVLPPALRTEPGYREYPANALERVLVVRRAIGIGFTLAELAEVLKVLDLARSGDRDDERLLGQQPCERQLRRRSVFSFRELGDAINKRFIRSYVFRSETIKSRT